MKWTIIDQHIVPAHTYSRYRVTWQLAATFGKTHVFLGLSTNPFVILTPLDAHTYQQTTLSHDMEAFEDLWANDRRNELPELRTFLESCGLLR